VTMSYGCGCINGIYMSMNSHLLVSTTSARNKAIDISTECLHGVFAMKIKSRILPLSFAITLTMVAGQAHADLANFPNSSPKCDTLQFKRLASFLQKPWLAA